MERRYESTCRKAEDDAGAEVMLPQTVTELEVLREHLAEAQGDRL